MVKPKMRVYEGDSWKGADEPTPPEKSRHELQILNDEAFAFGKMDHEEWSRRFDHLSSHNWMKPFPPPVQTIPVSG